MFVAAYDAASGTAIWIKKFREGRPGSSWGPPHWEAVGTEHYAQVAPLAEKDGNILVSTIDPNLVRDQVYREGMAIAVDREGNITVCGNTADPPAMVAIRLGRDGEMIWARQVTPRTMPPLTMPATILA